jgi:Toastrack DUF4097
MRIAVAFAFFAFLFLRAALPSEALEPTYKNEFHHSYGLSRSGSVTISDADGTVRVVGWRKNVVQLDAYECAPTQEELKSLTIVVNSAPSTLTVKTLFPRSSEGWSSWVRLLGGSTRCNQRPEVNYVIHVPDLAQVTLSSAAADLTVTGPIGSLRAHSASGDVSVTDVSGISVETQSGDVTLQGVRGVISVMTASGDTTFNDAKADITVHTSSGAVGLYRVSGKAAVNTASGDIIARAFAGIARINSASGDVSMTLVRAGDVALDANTVSGDLSCDVPRRAGGPIRVDTVSGDISVNWI